MRSCIALAAAAALSLSARSARAQISTELGPPEGTHQWSTTTGETVTPGRSVVSAEAGWPGLTLGYTHGLSQSTDLGVKLDLDYSLEKTTRTAFGLGLRVPFRAVLSRSGAVSVLVHADPGVRLYPSVGTTDDLGNASGSVSLFGLQLPVGVQIGVSLARNLRAEVGADLPMSVFVSPSADFSVGPQVGAGLEYFVDRDLSLGLDTRFGPLFVPTTSGAGATFTFKTQLVAGYRL